MGVEKFPFKVALIAVWLLLLCASATPAAAGGQPDPARRAVSDATLDSLRGGVSTDSLTMSIGIARAVFINGEPVVTTTLNIPLLNANGGVRAALTRQAGAAAAAATPVAQGSATRPVVVLGNQGMSIIQNGAGNAVTLQGLPSAATIIQNTLDNQAIRSVTTIDAKVFSSALAQRLNLAASMNAALLRPAGR